jgi:hypothetical protein
MDRHELSWNKAIHSAFEQVYDIPFQRDITDYKTAHSGESTAQVWDNADIQLDIG